MADTQTIRELAQTRAPFSAWLGVVLLFALFGVIVLAIIGPSPRGDTYEQKRAKAREEKLKAAREEDTKALTTYAWIDKSKGTARIPIERAMELAVTELAQKKPAAAGPIATPEQPTASINPTNAPPKTQPGASATPAATPVSGAAQPNPAKSSQKPPAQSSPGSPPPAGGKSPEPSASPQ